MTVDGGELRATGPDGRRWFVHYKVRVPDGANIDIEADNGPISISDVDSAAGSSPARRKACTTSET